MNAQFRVDDAYRLVAAESAVMALRGGDAVQINLVCVFQIGRIAGRGPELRGEQIGIDDRTGLGPCVVALEPVVVLVVFGHAVFLVQLPALFDAGNQRRVAGQGGVAEHAAQGRERGVGLGPDSRQVHSLEQRDQFVDQCFRLLGRNVLVRMDQSFHADEHAAHVGRERPAVDRILHAARHVAGS